MNITPIAFVHNGFKDKFGIPRQPLETDEIESQIVFEPAYRSPDAIRGIEGFSHLWLIWGFHAAPLSRSLTVRPPRLGGNVRMGVFATRSPFRPNGLGLSSVRLLRVEQGRLIVTGADMLDGTPVYDIKPYLRYCDSHERAVDGFVEHLQEELLPVCWPEGAMTEADRRAIETLLARDPRPRYQTDPERIYGMDYKDWNIRFRIREKEVQVIQCEKK